MQRPIKFRAWNKEQGCMYYTQDSLGMDGDGWIKNINFDARMIELCCGSDEGDYIEWFYIEWFDFESSLVMQYTGLKDKNGKEIYEGDLLKHDLWGLYQIIWDELSAGFRASRDEDNDLNLAHAQLQRCRVIGNIYENPELLEV